MPQIAIAAFTIELFLKLFHVLDHGKCPRGHDLLNLFQNLKFETRQKIRRRWKANVIPFYTLNQRDWQLKASSGREMDTQTLSTASILARQAFERDRYDFDTQRRTTTGLHHFGAVAETLLDVAIVAVQIRKLFRERLVPQASGRLHSNSLNSKAILVVAVRQNKTLQSSCHLQGWRVLATPNRADR
jgi:hypothetical protein